MEYITVKIPKSMGDEVDEILAQHHYTSRAEFVKAAIRVLLTDLKVQLASTPDEEMKVEVPE